MLPRYRRTLTACTRLVPCASRTARRTSDHTTRERCAARRVVSRRSRRRRTRERGHGNNNTFLLPDNEAQTAPLPPAATDASLEAFDAWASRNRRRATLDGAWRVEVSERVQRDAVTRTVTSWHDRAQQQPQPSRQRQQQQRTVPSRTKQPSRRALGTQTPQQPHRRSSNAVLSGVLRTTGGAVFVFYDAC
jgi:hypothetical protein